MSDGVHPLERKIYVGRSVLKAYLIGFASCFIAFTLGIVTIYLPWSMWWGAVSGWLIRL